MGILKNLNLLFFGKEEARWSIGRPFDSESEGIRFKSQWQRENSKIPGYNQFSCNHNTKQVNKGSNFTYISELANNNNISWVYLQSDKQMHLVQLVSSAN